MYKRTLSEVWSNIRPHLNRASVFKAITQPNKVAKYLSRRYRVHYSRFRGRRTGRTAPKRRAESLSPLFGKKCELRQYQEDICANKKFQGIFQHNLTKFFEAEAARKPLLLNNDEPTLSEIHGTTLYVICRAVNPDVVVETGVCSGNSSAYILQALEDNNNGVLHSIDLPEQPGNFDHGCNIPDYLLDRWNLHLGDSTEVLPELVSEFEGIDIFHHDSLHTYDQMKFEYDTVYEHLLPDGILASHDVYLTTAFQEFVNENNMRSATICKTGIARPNKK